MLGLRVNRKIVILSIARAVQAFGVSFLIVILPIYISGQQIDFTGESFFNLTITTEFLIGIAISTTPFISSIFQPFGGIISDFYKKRKLTILLGLGLLVLSIPAYLIINSYWIVLGLRILQGIAGALIVPAAAALINIESEDEVTGESFGFYNTSRLIGFGLGPIISGGIISFGSYKILSFSLSGVEFAFLSTFLASLISLAIVLAFIDEREVSTGRSQNNYKELIYSDKFKYLVILGMTNFLLAASIAVFVTLEEALSQRFNQSSFMFGIQFSSAILANTISQTPIGRLSDTYGRKPLILLGFVLLIPSITAQGFVVTGNQMLIARLIQGISVALVFAPSLALAGEIAEDKNSGLFLSVLTGSFQMGIALGPTVSGILFSVGGFSTPFIFSGIASSVGFVLVFLYLPSR